MLSPRLTNCPECANIPSLLKKIDCKLAELGNNLYNNISYMLNKPVPSSDILQLIGYRRILMYKYCNPNYVHKYSVQMIASRVIRLTLGCVSKCNEPERCLEEPCDIKIVPNPTTTSTSTLPITTTTTSTSSTSTSTTSTTTTAVPTTTTTSSSSSTTTTTSTSSSTTTTTTTSNSTAGCPIGYYGPVGFPNRETGNGTMTLDSGLVINTTYVGPALLTTGAQPPYTNCVGGQLSGDVGIGGTIPLNYNSGAFTFTITYSIAQTAVKFVMDGMGYATELGISEYYTFTTNAANTVVTELAGCNDFRVEAPNVVAGSMSSPEQRTGGNVEVVADAPFNVITITGNNSGNLAGTGFDMYICGIEPTTTTTSSSSTSTTTTTSTTLSPAECVALILSSGNIYTYDVDTNISIDRGAFTLSNDVANTATKMWLTGSSVQEYNITVFPWSATFNRNITYNPQLFGGNGLCAIDNTTLITTNPSVGYPQPIISLNISGSTAVETIIGYLPMNTFVTGDFIYTTTGKLIVTISSSVTSNYYIIQYDFATMNLEVQSTVPFFGAFGLIESNNKLYIVGDNGDLHEVDLNYPYGITLVQNTGLNYVAGASQIPSCCNVNLIPQSSSTTTTSSSSTTTSSTSSTTSTTTTLAPSGFNTIYTHFDAL